MGYMNQALVSGGAPSVFATRALTAADDGCTLTCSTAQTATVPSGMPPGFGALVRGPVTVVAGSGATVSDLRTAGHAISVCVILQTGSDAYEVIGGSQ